MELSKKKTWSNLWTVKIHSKTYGGLTVKLEFIWSQKIRDVIQWDGCNDQTIRVPNRRKTWNHQLENCCSLPEHSTSVPRMSSHTLWYPVVLQWYRWPIWFDDLPMQMMVFHSEIHSDIREDMPKSARQKCIFLAASSQLLTKQYIDWSLSPLLLGHEGFLTQGFPKLFPP